MKKLKTIRNISFTILILFVLYIGIIGLNILFDDKTYPTAHYGLTRTDEFFLTGRCGKSCVNSIKTGLLGENYGRNNFYQGGFST